MDLRTQLNGEIREKGGLDYTGLLGEGFVPIPISVELKEAVEKAELIIIVVPGPGHEYYARALAPILKDGQMVFLSPGHMGGGLHFQRVLKEMAPSLRVKVAEVNTLPYGCRLVGPAKVGVYVNRKPVLFSAFPGRHTEEMKAFITRLYPAFVTARNVLECGLNYLNALMHIPGMLMNTGWIEFSKGDFNFYSQGITPAVARTIEALDKERVQCLLKLGLPPVTFLERFFRQGYTTPQGLASGSVYRAFQESEANRARRAPSDLNHRYLMEDGPYGILPMAEVCHLAGVPPPVMDALITLASVAAGIDFRKEGLTLDKMGLGGVKAEEIDSFLFEGY